MKKLLFIALIGIISCTTQAKNEIHIPTAKQNDKLVHHNLTVNITPATSEITVIDSIDISSSNMTVFMLNESLIPVASSNNISIKKIETNVDPSDVGMDRDTKKNSLKINKWQIIGNAKSFVISYKGKIAEIEVNKSENYQRGFSEKPAVISETGVYLAGSSYWIPQFEDRLMNYNLTTTLPADWRTVSQGERIMDTKSSGFHTDKWACNNPQEEVFLIAAKFTEYSYKMNNGVTAMAFLRTPDEGMANKYLETTEQYMDMYQSMLGDYPYSKFALVENFWETGYGMPSFTLLGEKIIRFPFILHSSYPHELLHNWWGNSVYVDFESGNWCEGITAFMADHLIKEQRGKGEEYRRSVLQKFTNYVTPENDFPLSKFLSRKDGPSESIGYGKSLMVWQMLRRKLGDKIFTQGIKQFYDDNKYKNASYDDIRIAMEKVSDIDLKPFFTQWINRLGAPEIGIKSFSQSMYNGKHTIVLTLEQKQKSDIFNLDIPINVLTEEGVEVFVFNMNKRVQEFQINMSSKPLKLHVDPQYDVFRILDQDEAPPTLSKIWGSKENIIILPKNANKSSLAIYEEFAKQWKATDNDNFEIVYDNKLSELPSDKTHWILGFENKYVKEFEPDLVNFNSSFSEAKVVFQNKDIMKTGNSFVLTSFDKKITNKQSIFIATDNIKSIPGLVRKLPHYGKYSYLAFKGDEPTNISKGQWPVYNSPLVKIIDENAKNTSINEERQALASLPAVFSEKKMLANIKYLASKELKGRGIGTPELDLAAKHIAEQFEDAGLMPYGKTYYQKFSHKFDDKGEIKLTNVIGIIPGIDKELKDNPVVISAHYDHLGLGWPDAHKGDKGKIHYGADDNASGVATMLELARSMGKSSKPKRTIIFLACTAEEAGLIGSRYFVKHIAEYIKGEVFANVNIDTDGSLFDKKLLVLNANTAKEWKYIFMGTDYTTGIKTEVIEKQLDASDQLAFIEKGIPAVQLFTGPTQNYHRPTDTYEKIDGPGLVKVATVTKEVLDYLGDRENAMPFTGTNSSSTNSSSEKKKSRKVSTGTVPDFAYQGDGVRVGSVVDGSAGYKAGLKAGDIIIELDNKKANDLKVYSNLLKQYKPGDKVVLKVLRGDKEIELNIELGSR